MPQDISDIYIKGSKDPLFEANVVENVTFIDTVISKLHMILFTNKGDVLGDPNFGASIPNFLWKTRFPASTIKEDIEEQIKTYVPELSKGLYTLNVFILPGTVADIAVVQIDLGVSNISVLFK